MKSLCGALDPQILPPGQHGWGGVTAGGRAGYRVMTVWRLESQLRKMLSYQEDEMGAAGTDETELGDVVYRYMEKVWRYRSVKPLPVGGHRESVKDAGA